MPPAYQQDQRRLPERVAAVICVSGPLLIVMARPSLFLLLLCAPAALGQSAEPSPYDSNVADYSCTACPVNSGSDPCPVTVEQTGPKAATATISNAAGAVAAYLTDATGTVIAYTSSPSTSISFDFSETDAWADYSYPGSPSGLIAHVVFASTCSSSAMVSTWVSTAVPGPSPLLPSSLPHSPSLSTCPTPSRIGCPHRLIRTRPARCENQDAILDNYMSSDESTFGADGTMTSGGSAPTATVASANVLTGGSYSVTFPKAATSVLAWIRDSTGTLLFVKVARHACNCALPALARARARWAGVF